MALPKGVLVSKDSDREENSQPYSSNTSIILTKSGSERLILSSLINKNFIYFSCSYVGHHLLKLRSVGIAAGISLIRVYPYILVSALQRHMSICVSMEIESFLSIDCLAIDRCCRYGVHPLSLQNLLHND